MNDRYLYRAKRTDNGELVEGYYLFCPIQADNKPSVENFIYKHWIVTHNGNPFEVDPSTICQCTGLKDKNGNLIWENDIMVAHLDDSFPKDTTYTRVVWNNNGFCTKEQGSEDISPLDKFDQEHYEVCGNIFDNPELLEQED